MKYGLRSFVLTIFLLSCHEEKNNVLRRFIPGSYQRSIQNEFSVGSDTLMIYDAGNNIYMIDHLLTYQRIIDGKKLQAERKMEKWITVFNETDGVLNEAKKGRVLSFQPEQNRLFVGGSSYQKFSK